MLLLRLASFGLIASAIGPINIAPVFDAASVHRVRLQLDDAIKITVNQPTLLKSGLWVTVAWDGVADPSATDFLGCYAPADADLTAVVPIKFNYASSDSGYLGTGSGSTSFRLVNLRSDYSFAFFRGNVTHPVYTARSSPVSVGVAGEPLQVHLALTSNPSEMRVVWKTSAEGTDPTVRYHARTFSNKASVTHRVKMLTKKGSTSGFGKDELCGAPAQAEGFFETGLVHTAVMEDLQPATMYTYQVGDADLDLWSNEQTFTSQPSTVDVDPASMVYMAVFGDLSFAEQDGSFSAGLFANDAAALDTTRLLTNLAEEQALGLAVIYGDLSYATGYLSHWDSFNDMVEPFAARVPFMTSPGNHESDDPAVLGPPSRPQDGPALYRGNDAGGECSVPYITYYQMPRSKEGMDYLWYAFSYGPIRHVMLSTEHDFREGSVQYTWLEEELAAVDTQATPWVLVGGHRPMYMSSVDDAGTELSPSDQTGARLLRKHLEPLLLRYRVNMYLSGHHHSYQRTCKLAQGECVARAGDDGPYKGPIYAIVGTAGRRLSVNLEPSPPSFIEHIESPTFGIATIRADAHKLEFTYMNTEGKVLDQVTLRVPWDIMSPPPATRRKHHSPQDIPSPSRTTGHHRRNITDLWLFFMLLCVAGTLAIGALLCYPSTISPRRWIDGYHALIQSRSEGNEASQQCVSELSQLSVGPDAGLSTKIRSNRPYYTDGGPAV